MLINQLHGSSARCRRILLFSENKKAPAVGRVADANRTRFENTAKGGRDLKNKKAPAVGGVADANRTRFADPTQRRAGFVKQKSTRCCGHPLLCWHLPIFPARRHASIVGTTELNFCVRNGNRWTLCVNNTNYSLSLGVLSLSAHLLYCKTVYLSTPQNIQKFCKCYARTCRNVTHRCLSGTLLQKNTNEIRIFKDYHYFF